MTIYTYQISRSISESLGISFTEIPELSDQMIDSHQSDDHFANYATRGGGAAGSKNGHYGCKHTEETKQVLREMRLGKAPSNKGIPNPECSERMKKNNPMFNMDARERMRQSKIGKEPSNKIKHTIEFDCKWCGKSHTVIARKKNVKSFCNKSCASSYSNTYRYISQPPAAEQASS
jgi:hypothetical protein